MRIDHIYYGTRKYSLPKEDHCSFVVVDLPFSYNAILGGPILHKLKATTSIYYYCMEFRTPGRVGIVPGDKLRPDHAMLICLDQKCICFKENK